MAKTALVTDSAVNLPRDMRDRYGITVVPVHLFLDGRLYRDEVDITCAEFYHWFRQNPDAHVSTACPPPGDFLRTYEALAVDHDAVISVHVASDLSGTFASAEQAAALLPTVAIDLIDSGSVSMGSGFCVLAAARSLEAGGSAAEAAAAARAVAARVELHAALATLRYAARTGRVPAIAAHAGSALRLHAIISVHKGRAELERIE
ncbi:MAG: DegV family protein, partial [Thermoleophilia bacterium]|nr:DegV family protein [Thermoleophilia bacterium]